TAYHCTINTDTNKIAKHLFQGYLYIFYFFFSSRRRHTRSKRDWSSDVCSSDLPKTRAFPKARLSEPFSKTTRPRSWRAAPLCFRSEERRVGKECRWRWSAVL